ncbi:MAG: hypothetical protein SFU56_06515 [Capsulimonadales bacterium]|nr:hypothetical protein [Capsulimonadales bacterium]
MSRLRTVICLSMLWCAISLTGCRREETPEAAVKAGANSRDRAKAFQAESERRQQAGEALLNGR